MLTHKPCVNCLDFLARIRRETGISVITEPRPFLERGVRATSRKGCSKCSCEDCLGQLSAVGQRTMQKQCSVRPSKDFSHVETFLNKSDADGEAAASIVGDEIQEEPNKGTLDISYETRPRPRRARMARSPAHWIRYANCSKPKTVPVNKDPFSDGKAADVLPRNQTPFPESSRKRSMFFQTPVTVGVEVGLPQMSVDRARQYRRLSADVPDTSASPEPRTAMAVRSPKKTLGRFAYADGPGRRTTTTRSRVSRKVSRKPATSRGEMLQSKSLFAKVYKTHRG